MRQIDRLVPPTLDAVRVIYTGNTLLPVSCGHHDRRLRHWLLLADGMRCVQGHHLAGPRILKGILRGHAIDHLAGVHGRRRTELRRVHGEREIPRPRKTKAVRKQCPKGREGCTHVMIRVGSQLFSSTSGIVNGWVDVACGIMPRFDTGGEWGLDSARAEAGGVIGCDVKVIC